MPKSEVSYPAKTLLIRFDKPLQCSESLNSKLRNRDIRVYDPQIKRKNERVEHVLSKKTPIIYNYALALG